MLKPTASDIQAYAADYSTIPLCREIYADITTPIALLRKIAQVSDRYFLLESVEGGERWGRYSFLGFDPIVHVTCKDHVVTTEYADGRPAEAVTTDNPNEVLRALMAQYRAPRIEGFPPFTGGLVGYYAYRMIAYAIVLILVMIFRPQGLLGSYDFSLSRIIERVMNRDFPWKKRGDAPAADVTEGEGVSADAER